MHSEHESIEPAGAVTVDEETETETADPDSDAAAPGTPGAEADVTAEVESPARAEAESDVNAEADVPARPRRLAILLAVAALALGIDIISKIIVVAKLSDRVAPVKIPGGFLQLTLIRNSGAAFSIGESQTWAFTLIAVAVVVVILRISRNLRSMPWACALGLLLGGALGNLGDRIFRSPGLFQGHVVDFLQFPTFPVINWDFPVFNLADSAIVVGGCLMVLLSFRGIQPDGTRSTNKD